MVGIYACGQLFFTTNTTLQALLNARGEVRELAVTNVASKFLWGGGVVLGLAVGGSVLFVAAAYLVTEAGKTAVLLGAVRKHLSLQLGWKVRPALPVLLAALPFFLNYLAHDIYARVDVLMLSWMTNDAEVGWYGAAVNINLLALLVLPVLNAVLLPMSSRIAQESTEALNEMMRGTLRIIIVIAVPLAMILVLHAEDIVHLLYSQSFAPSQRTLQILAPMIPMSYVCVVAASHLVQLERVWTVTRVSIAGLVIHPLLNLVTIPRGAQMFGDGGAGMGAAAGSLLSELMVTVMFLIALGRAGPDRRFAWVVARLAAVCATVAVLHNVLPAWSLLTIPIELLVYLGLGTASGAIPLALMWSHLKAALAHRRGRT
jgi:O-antigen/teichoic acid export membrane protein